MKLFAKNIILLISGLVLVLHLMVFAGFSSCDTSKQDVAASEVKEHCSMPETDKATCCSTKAEKPISKDADCQIACDCDFKAIQNEKPILPNTVKSELDFPIACTLFIIESISIESKPYKPTTHPPGLFINQPIYLSTETFRI